MTALTDKLNKAIQVRSMSHSAVTYHGVHGMSYSHKTYFDLALDKLNANLQEIQEAKGEDGEMHLSKLVHNITTKDRGIKLFEDADIGMAVVLLHDGTLADTPLPFDYYKSILVPREPKYMVERYVAQDWTKALESAIEKLEKREIKIHNGLRALAGQTPI